MNKFSEVIKFANVLEPAVVRNGNAEIVKLKFVSWLKNIIYWSRFERLSGFPCVWKGCRKTGYHMASLWTPHMPIFWREKKIGRKWGTKNWDLGSIMAVKTTFLPFWASEWVPSVWKGRRKTGHHMASLWTPHMPIFWRKKIGQKRDPQIWDLGSGMAQKWSKMIQMPIICMKSSYLTNHYPHFIDFKMLRLIWTKMAETP